MAMINLGISREDLKKKTQEDFNDASIEQEVLSVRFKFYQTRMMHTLNKLLEERHRLKNHCLLNLIESSSNPQQAAARYWTQSPKLPSFVLGASSTAETLKEIVTSPKLRQPFQSRAGSSTKRESILAGVCS